VARGMKAVALALGVLGAATLSAGSWYTYRALQAEELPTPYNPRTCCLWPEWEEEQRTVGASELEFRRSHGIPALAHPDDRRKCLHFVYDAEGEPVVLSGLVDQGRVVEKWMLPIDQRPEKCQGLPSEEFNVADIVCYHQ